MVYSKHDILDMRHYNDVKIELPISNLTVVVIPCRQIWSVSGHDTDIDIFAVCSFNLDLCYIKLMQYSSNVPLLVVRCHCTAYKCTLSVTTFISLTIFFPVFDRSNGVTRLTNSICLE